MQTVFSQAPVQLLNKNEILAQLAKPRPGHIGRLWFGSGVIGISLFGMVAAFGTVSDYRFSDVPRSTVLESLALPAVTSMPNAQDSFLRDERVKQGDTVADLLKRLGIDDHAASEFLQSQSSTQALYRQLSPGKNLTVRTDAEGALQSLVFPLNAGKDQALVVERHASGFTASEKSLSLDTRLIFKSAEIRHSLFGASDAAGIPDVIATQLADIFGGDIDFHRDLRKGDHFSVIYESQYFLGRAVRSGRIIAAEFVNNGKAYRAAWFSDQSGIENSGGYYTADGKNIRKAFLRSPLEFSRVTSGFSMARFHPVLQTWRAHKGIDYGAPTGTRVKATGDGYVEFAGFKGGYGKVVVLRHQNRYTTLYGHLSAFAPNLRAGSRVSQGDIVGYVGATGLASGPHLHYEFRVNEVHQNPLSIALPTAPPLNSQQLTAFRAQTQDYLARIDMISGFNLAQSE